MLLPTLCVLSVILFVSAAHSNMSFTEEEKRTIHSAWQVYKNTSGVVDKLYDRMTDSLKFRGTYFSRDFYFGSKFNITHDTARQVLDIGTTFVDKLVQDESLAQAYLLEKGLEFRNHGTPINIFFLYNVNDMVEEVLDSDFGRTEHKPHLSYTLGKLVFEAATLLSGTKSDGYLLLLQDEIETLQKIQGLIKRDIPQFIWHDTPDDIKNRLDDESQKFADNLANDTATEQIVKDVAQQLKGPDATKLETFLKVITEMPFIVFGYAPNFRISELEAGVISKCASAVALRLLNLLQNDIPGPLSLQLLNRAPAFTLPPGAQA